MPENLTIARKRNDSHTLEEMPNIKKLKKIIAEDTKKLVVAKTDWVKNHIDSVSVNSQKSVDSLRLYVDSVKGKLKNLSTSMISVERKILKIPDYTSMLDIKKTNTNLKDRYFELEKNSKIISEKIESMEETIGKVVKIRSSTGIWDVL